MLEKNGDSMSTKQIRAALGLKKTATVKVKAELQKLIKDKKIIKQGTRFFLNKTSKEKTLPKEKIKRDHKKSFFTKKHSHTEKKNHVLKTETGYFTRNRKGFGFVNIGVGLSDVFIGENEQFYAMEGDLVKIKIQRSRGFRGKRKGQIVRILERASNEILARVKRTKRETLAVPILKNIGFPFLRIENKDDIKELESGTLIEVELLKDKKISNRNFSKPSGRFLRAIDETSNLELGLQLIINENLIRTKYPENAKEYLKKFPKQVRFDSDSGRKDLRNLNFITIDGKDARDFDDAVCVIENRKLSGGFILYVSIADVAHYVKPGDPVDKEAYLRGTSVYFPRYSVHMIPEELSNNLCSLRPKVNRLTLTCEMQINSYGEIEDYSIYESIIQSRARLIYEDVADLIDGKISSIRDPKLQSSIKKMNHLSKILERKRFQRGAVQFRFAEEVFNFDKDERMIGVKRNYQSSSMKLIEQFMLEANETVAKHCKNNGIPSIFRVHDSPDMKKLKKLQKVFHRFGIRNSMSSLNNPKKFNDILEKIKDFSNFEQLQVLLLRSMSLAVYETNNKGHFGLAAKYYTHFTSPIRRYPDLLVHRALKKKINSDQKNENTESLINSELAEFCSQQERRAEKAERQSIDLIKVDFFANLIGQTFQAIVTHIESNGFRINIEPHGIEWFLLLESIPNDSYIYDEASISLQSRSKKQVIQGGKRLEILLLNADQINRTLEFKVEQWLN